MSRDESGALRRLVDKDAIVDLVHRYSYGVDHRRYDDVAMLFTDDCVVDYGPEYAPIRGRRALRAMFDHPVGFLATSHHNANVLVTFTGADRAEVRASVYAWHQRADLTTAEVWGYYHDTVVREVDGWLFASRQLRALGTEHWDVAMHPAVDPSEG